MHLQHYSAAKKFNEKAESGGLRSMLECTLKLTRLDSSRYYASSNYSAVQDGWYLFSGLDYRLGCLQRVFPLGFPMHAYIMSTRPFVSFPGQYSLAPRLLCRDEYYFRRAVMNFRRAEMVVFFFFYNVPM